MSKESFSHALPLNYLIGSYKIEGYLGEGGFGITYLARHSRLQDLVAIKEYFPSEFSMREAGSTVIPKTQSQDTYAWGLERFLDEAKTLIQFKHPNIITVRDYFEMNHTGYIVMDYEVGRTFKGWLKEQFALTGEAPSEQQLLDIVIPILDALSTLHNAKYLHRDIKPDNIYVRSNGTSVLIDFGASRQALGDKSKSLSTILSPGYAPKEQYSSRGNFGPWTDLYALSATLYYAITGHKPPSSTDRGDARDEGLADPLIPAQEICKDKYSEDFLQAIDAGLAYLPKDRPQTAEEFKIALLKGSEKTLSTPKPAKHKISPKQKTEQKTKSSVPWATLIVITVIGLGMVAFIKSDIKLQLPLELNQTPVNLDVQEAQTSEPADDSTSEAKTDQKSTPKTQSQPESFDDALPEKSATPLSKKERAALARKQRELEKQAKAANVSEKSDHSNCSGDCNEGYGTFTDEDGSKYVGNWKNGLKHGHGTYIYGSQSNLSGEKYVGAWAHGLKEGQGVYTDKLGVYQGEFKNDLRNGQGTYTWKKGDKYVGEWRDGVQEGQGTLTFENGDQYVGEFKNNRFDGHGVLTQSNGKVKDGNWSEGEFVQFGDIELKYR